MSETSLKTFEQTRIEKLEEALLEHEMKIDRLEKILDMLVKTQEDDIGGFC